MFALFHPDENEYVGIDITHDEANLPYHCLAPYSQLDSDSPYLLVTRSREGVEKLLDIAKSHYTGDIPSGDFVSDFNCYIPNLSEYIVVEMLPSL